MVWSRLVDVLTLIGDVRQLEEALEADVVELGQEGVLVVQEGSFLTEDVQGALLVDEGLQVVADFAKLFDLSGGEVEGGAVGFRVGLQALIDAGSQVLTDSAAVLIAGNEVAVLILVDVPPSFSMSPE